MIVYKNKKNLDILIVLFENDNKLYCLCHSQMGFPERSSIIKVSVVVYMADFKKYLENTKLYEKLKVDSINDLKKKDKIIKTIFEKDF